MARNGWLLVVSAAASTLMACAHSRGAPEGYRSPQSKDDGVRVIATEAATKTGLPECSLAMRLGEKEDESVLEFLARAEAAGARYVSDVDVVFAAEQNGQLLQCRTHIQPVATVEHAWAVMPARRLMRTGGERMLSGYQTDCRPDSAGRMHCVQVPVNRESPTLFAFRAAADIRVTPQASLRRLWRLKKSAPECTPREGDARDLLVAAERVEGRAYGCDAASASGCEDWVL